MMLITWRQIVFGLLFIFSLNPVFAGLKPRWTPPKPIHTEVGKNDFARCITVKFIEGSIVRLREGNLVSLTGYDLSGFVAVSEKNQVEKISRLFTRSEELLDAQRLEGQRRSGKHLADLNNYYRVILPEGSDPEPFIDALNSLKIIEIAFPVPRPAVAEDIPPDTPDFSGDQGYLYDAPEGIDAPSVWQIEGGTGAGVKIIDIEGAWHFDHEDFKEAFYAEIEEDYWPDHGDAVIGIMIGQHNGYGIDGICPDAEIGGQTIGDVYPDGGWPNVADIIDTVVQQLDPGDLYLIELHAEFSGVLSPMETWQDNFDVIETASANGIICMEAAGNGSSDLDADLYDGRFDPENRHSGAILVGAGAPPSGNYGPDRCRLDFSNYGQRVDLQGWGREVTTAGYGDLFYPNSDELQWYTNSFSGTSSATPIVSGAVACIQGIYKARNDGEDVLSAQEIRDILVESGSPQSDDGLQGHIGPRPNLSEAINLLYTPGILYGSVIDAGTGDPLEGVDVFTNYGFSAITDEEGYWRIDFARSVIAFHITASMQDYLDSTCTNLELAEADSLEINFGLLHGNFALSQDRFASALYPGETEEFNLEITNNGNGLVIWESERSYEEGESGFGGYIENFLVGPLVDDLQLEGVAFAEDHFFVTARNGVQQSMVHVFSLDGEYQRSFEQPGTAVSGMLDLTWDGNVLWGSGERDVYAFDLEGNMVSSFEGPFVNNKALAYDFDQDALWISSTVNTIICTDLNGNRITALNGCQLRITGMAYWQEDPHGFNLYVMHSEGANSQEIYKFNIDTGDTMFVADLEPEFGGQPGGVFIAEDYDRFGNTFIVLINDYLNMRGDRIDVWQIGTYKGWMSLEPDLGELGPESALDLNLVLNPSGLFASVYDGQIFFRHNGIGGADTVSVSLEVFDLGVPGNRESENPRRFELIPIHPNPFNNSTMIRYYLPHGSDVTVEVFDVSGRLVANLGDGFRHSGFHETVWNADFIGAGIYFIRAEYEDQVRVSKAVLVK